MKPGDKALCKLTVIPVRVDHQDTAEMVNQLLFGELVTVLDTFQQWIKIEIYHDNYTGWVDTKQLLPITPKSAKDLTARMTFRQQEESIAIRTPWGNQIILQGSPILSESLSFKIDSFTFKWSKDIPPNQNTNKNTNIKSLALTYLNSPYLWGGRTKFGIDCSGLTQTIFHQIGIFLHRDTSQQVQQGRKVKLEEKKEGDVAFFQDNKTNNITHVGIVLHENKIIHAHGRVRIDVLDSTGIYNETEEYYSHQLHTIQEFTQTKSKV